MSVFHVKKEEGINQLNLLNIYKKYIGFPTLRPSLYMLLKFIENIFNQLRANTNKFNYIPTKKIIKAFSNYL